MSEKTCPYCGHDNDSQLGTIKLGAGSSGRIDTNRLKCDNCKRTFERGGD